MWKATQKLTLLQEFSFVFGWSIRKKICTQGFFWNRSKMFSVLFQKIFISTIDTSVVFGVKIFENKFLIHRNKLDNTIYDRQQGHKHTKTWILLFLIWNSILNNDQKFESIFFKFMNFLLSIFSFSAAAPSWCKLNPACFVNDGLKIEWFEFF